MMVYAIVADMAGYNLLAIESPALNFERNRPLMVEEKSFLLKVKFFVVFPPKKTLFVFVNH